MFPWKKHIWKIILTLLFATAVVFGILQRTPEAPPKNQPQLRQTVNQLELQQELRSLFQKGSLLSQDNPEQTAITFIAVGDIMLSRRIAQTIQKKQDPNFPLAPISELLTSTDFNFANLESPFSSKDTFNAGRTFSFNAPKTNAKLLVDNKFSVVSTANNHAFDQGSDGIFTTLRILRDNNILPVGTATTTEQAWIPQILSIKKVKIAFLAASYASENDGGIRKNSYVARIEDTEKLKAALFLARQQANFVIVSMHAGIEYTRKPNEQQTAFARAAIDNGADIVIGAHPHWIQTIEEYKGKYIFYSLGNFVFDQDWSQETSEGLTIKVTLTTQGIQHTQGATINDLQGTKIPLEIKQIELIPVIISKDLQTRKATDAESKKILDSINQTTRFLYPQNLK